MKRIYRGTCAISLIAVVAAPGYASTADPNEERHARLADALQAVADSAASLRTAVRVSTLAPLDAEWEGIDRAMLAEAPALDQYDEEVDWLWHDNRLRVERRHGDGRPLATLIWDGREWFRMHQGTVSIFSRPQDLSHDYLPVFNGGVGWPSFLSVISPSQMVKEGVLLDVVEEDSVTRFRYATSPNLDSAARIEVVVSNWSPFRVDSFTLDVIGPQGAEDAGKLLIRQQLVFLTWSEHDELLLPSSALFIEGNWIRENTLIGVRRLERLHASVLQPGPSTEAVFDTAPLFADKTRVVDRSNDLQYTIGSSTVLVGTDLLSVEGPITGRITTADFRKLGSHTGGADSKGE
jgi:hypothetical protein